MSDSNVFTYKDKVLIIKRENFSHKYRLIEELVNILRSVYPKNMIQFELILEACMARHLSICEDNLASSFRAIYDALSDFIIRCETTKNTPPLDIYYIANVFNILATRGNNANQKDIQILKDYYPYNIYHCDIDVVLC